MGVRAAIRWAPVVLVPAAIAVFAVFEYSRSWNFYQAKTGGSFVDFAIDRFALLLRDRLQQRLDRDGLRSHPGRLPLRTLEAFWSAPVIDQLNLYDRLSPGVTATFKNYSSNTATRSSTTQAACLTLRRLWPSRRIDLVRGSWIDPRTDLPVLHRGATWAVLIYPILVTGLFELPRYMYWTQGRVLPAIVALLAVAWYAARSPDHDKDLVEKEHSLTAPVRGDPR